MRLIKIKSKQFVYFFTPGKKQQNKKEKEGRVMLHAKSILMLSIIRTIILVGQITSMATVKFIILFVLNNLQAYSLIFRG